MDEEKRLLRPCPLLFLNNRVFLPRKVPGRPLALSLGASECCSVFWRCEDVSCLMSGLGVCVLPVWSLHFVVRDHL